MSAKQITVPLEVYVRLQELASLAGYSYREAEDGEAAERIWDLTNDEGASLLDEHGAIRPEAAELYFTLMPLIAHEFVQQQQALVEAYRKTPKPAAARAKIRPSNQRLIPLTEVPLENQRIAARIEQEFYGEVPESRRIYGVLPGVMDYMMRHDLGYPLLLEIIESPESVVREETAEENRYGREVTLYTHEDLGYQVVLNPLTVEVLALRPLKASAGGYQLSPDAQSQLKALGLTSEYITRILDEADNRQPIPGTSRTVYSLNGYQVEFSHSEQQVIRIARGVAANRNPFESQPRMSGRKRQRGRKIPHDVDEFVQLLQEHGFTVTMGGKHYDIRHEALAPGQKAVTSVTPSDSQRWHLNSARQIRNTFGIDLRYANPRDSVRGIVQGTNPANNSAKDALPAEDSASESSAGTE
ncbi:MAG: cell wall biosynthesis glycosyltransferase [Rothia mucilaginosa]|uniref:cell wall biosynthesis glycosyltransferase n=1 Tax=Rothia mucilaginosa TaxID=43675 RepID=UPI001D2C1812|nr:cell wall biosynthesis glycosyltransferase [Rothia mucilaginosa]MBS6433482.1 cell wall biosynthesis glycosyltransferase [Rothia mucilaginosa]